MSAVASSASRLAEKDVYLRLESSNVGDGRDSEQLLLVPCLDGGLLG